MEQLTWPRIAVLGAGAVGCYFGGMLARAGAPVTLIGRRPHVEAIARDGLFLESLRFRQHVHVAAVTDTAAVRDADVVLLCVKTRDTADAARALVPHLSGGVVVVSLQNGVDNVERIRAAGGVEVVAAAVYVGAEMTGPGRVKHTARGDLVVGDLPRRAPGADLRRHRPETVAALFERAGVPCRVSDDVEAELWTKLIINCACNAISALTRSRYGRMAANHGTRDLMRQVVEEAVAVAGAAGVSLPAGDMVAAAWQLAANMSGTLSSTAQDIGLGKPTEIDALNGYVARRGAEVRIATPINRALHALVKLLEESAAEGRGLNVS